MIPVVTIVFLLEMGKVWGIYALAIGTIGGFVLQGGLLAFGLKLKRISLIPRWYGMDPATKQVMNQYAPMVAGAFLMSSTGLVDQSMAAMLESGSVATLNYSQQEQLVNVLKRNPQMVGYLKTLN